MQESIGPNLIRILLSRSTNNFRGNHLTMKIATVFLTVLVLLFLGVNQTNSSQKDAMEVRLAASEMQSTWGGVEVQSFSKPSNSITFYTDNLPVEADIRHQYVSDDAIILETYVNNSKEDVFVVSPHAIRWLEIWITRWANELATWRKFWIDIGAQVL